MQLHRFSTFTSYLVILMALFGARAAVADATKLRIVTDIAPIHSLVTMVVGHQIDVELLVPASQSPHSFNLKPSQIRNINHADLIVLLSDSFTPSLSRHLSTINKKSVVLQLSGTGVAHPSQSFTDFKHTKHASDDGTSLEHINEPLA